LGAGDLTISALSTSAAAALFKHCFEFHLDRFSSPEMQQQWLQPTSGIKFSEF
jgi:hypothetical protein